MRNPLVEQWVQTVRAHLRAVSTDGLARSTTMYAEDAMAKNLWPEAAEDAQKAREELQKDIQVIREALRAAPGFRTPESTACDFPSHTWKTSTGASTLPLPTKRSNGDQT